MGLRDFARSLRPGNDRELAATQYAGQESATDRAARLRREQQRNQGSKRAATQGTKWETADRARDRRGGTRLTNWRR
ncbi:hypothetical protein ACH40E_02970 [Streptomyces acidicola]|uniref:hypothetical protein n=1 Tax=Streptomyces acidicola TaxID=2596892 RepID=UPI0037AA8F59